MVRDGEYFVMVGLFGCCLVMLLIELCRFCDLGLICARARGGLSMGV